ncbi:heavy-metal-associated domain-containing protein [Aestuariivivens sediminicola]|uniref:heavy-metal-associated domain-containing protein n=1 Tax=Aestuariivivens sediminicola TaxID=2913560 RepID=UPI001F55BA3E|nr:heavy metal-associated domain-containing protein [Aestuariivivens sediminicola]
MEKIFEIQNLKCGGCAKTITSRLNDMAPISNVSVNMVDQSVTFSYQNETDVSVVKEVLKKLGYPVVGDANAVKTRAKSYISCAIGRISA